MDYLALKVLTNWIKFYSLWAGSNVIDCANNIKATFPLEDVVHIFPMRNFQVH